MKYNDAQFIEIIKQSKSIRQSLKKLGLKEAGGNYKTVKLRIKRLGLDMSHFGELKERQGWAKGKKFPGRRGIPLKDILINNSTYTNTNCLRKRLINEGILERKCCSCGNTTWLGLDISLELDHINGNNDDFRIENLRLLCPNCHSQTPTYRGKNIIQF